jgi:NAD(P)-dependent dehydrogenase (short-subunit alcohol dehydrogenase family)
LSIKDKVIVVFGGSKGIGYSIARGCLNAGAKTIIASSDPKHLMELEKDFPNLKVIKCDVTSYEDIENLYNEVEQKIGPVYGIVCSAGIYGPICPLEETSFKTWEKALDINLTGVVRCIHPIIGKMKQRRQGRIILMSGGGQGPMPNFSSYIAAKGGVWRLTESLGSEFAPFNVYLNAIAPGAVNTTFLDEVLSAGKDKAGALFYENSLIQKQSGGTPPEKAVECAMYLLSQESDRLYGKIISAVWDKYSEFQNLNEISQSEIYTMKRVINKNGGTKFEK